MEACRNWITMTKPRLLYISPSAPTFVRNDLALLSDGFDVRSQIYPWTAKWKIPVLLVRQALVFARWGLLRPFGVWRPDYIIVSFPGFWSVLPVFFRRWVGCRVYIILNGTDSCAFPELGYGDLRKPHLKALIGYSLRGADGLMPVSASLMHNVSTYYASPAHPEQGVLAHFPGLSTPACVIANGIDPSFWGLDPAVERVPNRAITVLGKGQEMRKGVDTIIQAANKYSNIEFLIIGIDSLWEHGSNISISKNIKLLGRCTPTQLRDHYHSSQYYLQWSRFEGFGVAMIEAMACGCIPLVSAACSLPQTSDALPEHILQHPDMESVNKLLTDLPISAEAIDPTLNVKISTLTLENYTFAKRKVEIEKFIVRQECKSPSDTLPS